LEIDKSIHGIFEKFMVSTNMLTPYSGYLSCISSIGLRLRISGLWQYAG